MLRTKLRLVEVPVVMKMREHGTSSITLPKSIYYLFKVTLALLIAMARRATLPADERGPH